MVGCNLLHFKGIKGISFLQRPLLSPFTFLLPCSCLGLTLSGGECLNLAAFRFWGRKCNSPGNCYSGVALNDHRRQGSNGLTAAEGSVQLPLE